MTYLKYFRIIVAQAKEGKNMNSHTIEIDERVWRYLQSQAIPFKDTPNSVLHRILFNEGNFDRLSRSDNVKKGIAPRLPDGTPKALAQILEVLYEMNKLGMSRPQATNIVAQRRRTSPQTIIDKYCRQLNKRAYEIDRLLQQKDLTDFKLLLENKFTNHKDVINSFFNTLQFKATKDSQPLNYGKSPVQNESEYKHKYQNTINICKNKSSEKSFIYIEDINSDKALLVTPKGEIKSLEYSLFNVPEEKNTDYSLSQGLITKQQLKQYHEFIDNDFFDENSDPDRFPKKPFVSQKTFSSTITEKKITQDDLIPYIIKILHKHGGSVSKKQVDEEIYQMFQNEFQDEWYQGMVSHDIPRWKHNIAWSKERAKNRHGFIKSAEKSGHGIWELTQEGEKYYQTVIGNNG